MSVKIIPAYSNPKDVQTLFSEYTQMLISGDSTFQEYLNIQHYDDEIKHLESKYGMPYGRLYLAYWNDEAGDKFYDAACDKSIDEPCDESCDESCDKSIDESCDESGDKLNDKFFDESGDKLAGCIGLRKIDDQNCEMKRLYVRPEFRGNNIGDQLISLIISDAKQIGYSHMLLDTLPFLQSAIHMYKKRGFYEIESYNDSPMENSIYMKLDL